jgi:DNA-directed RNA polymerase sigma subunit (sigma70/sigma32)
MPKRKRKRRTAEAKVESMFEQTRRRIRAIERKALAKIRRRPK